MLFAPKRAVKSKNEIARIAQTLMFLALVALSGTGCIADTPDADARRAPDRGTMAATDGLFGSYGFLLEVSGITPDQDTIIGGFKQMTTVGDNPTLIRLEDGYSPSLGLLPWAEAGTSERRAGTMTCLDQDLNSIIGGAYVAHLDAELTSDGDGIDIRVLRIVAQTTINHE